MSLYPVPPIEQEEELPPRPRAWWRWVAVLVVVAMVVATPFIYVFSHGSREPRTIRVPVGRAVTFAPGVAEPGDTIRCVSPTGPTIGAVVPDPGRGAMGNADGQASFASITVETARDGRVFVRCEG